MNDIRGPAATRPPRVTGWHVLAAVLLAAALLAALLFLLAAEFERHGLASVD